MTTVTTVDIEPLSEAVEQRLIMEAQAGNERAMERLLDAYAPAIERAARKYEHDRDPEDALQEARCQFIQIVQEHDFSKSLVLRTYAHARLADYMTSELSESSNLWGIPGRTLRRFYEVYTKADGNLSRAADLAPEYGMKSLTFATIAEMLRVGSLDEQTGEDEDAAPRWDSVVGVAVGCEEPTDAYDAVLTRLTIDEVMGDAVSNDHLRIIRMAYGFDGALDTGEEIADPLPSTVSLAAHSDATVAAAMTWADYVEADDDDDEHPKPWTRSKVQRFRSAQLSTWRDKYAKADTEED